VCSLHPEQMYECALSAVSMMMVIPLIKSLTDSRTPRASLQLAAQNLKALSDLERLQRLRAEKGDISELELLRLQVQQYQFQRDASDARQALNAAKVALRTFIGPDQVAEDYEIVGELLFQDF